MGGTEAEPVSELGVADELPLSRGCVAVSKDRGGRLSLIGHEVPDDPAHGANRTKVR